MQNQGSKGYNCGESRISKRLEEGEEDSEFHFHQVAQVLMTEGWTNTNEDEDEDAEFADDDIIALMKRFENHNLLLKSQLRMRNP